MIDGGREWRVYASQMFGALAVSCSCRVKVPLEAAASTIEAPTRSESLLRI